MTYHGNITEDDTLDIKFTTRSGDTMTTLSGTPTVAAYKGNSTTQSTAGLTLTTDFDSVTGLNNLRVVTTDAFYVTGEDYTLVITAGTIDGVSVVGRVIGTFSVESRFMRGTDSAATAAALATVDANVDAILLDTAEIGAAGAGLTNIVLPSGGLANVTAWTVNITGNITGSVSEIAGDVLGDINGNVDGSVANVTGGINTAAGTITTLDALDTAQDTQHGTTQGKVDTVDGIVDAILVDTGTTLPASLAAAQTDLDTITDTGVTATNMRGTDGANTTAPDNASVTAIKAVTDKLDDTLEDDGGTQRFTSNALEQGPSGGGGGDATLANQAILLARTAAAVTVTATNQADANSDFADAIRRGDEYSTAAGNAPTVTATGFPNSPWGTSTTATLKIKQDGVWATTGAVAVAHDGDVTVTLTITLTEAETAALTANTTTTYEIELLNGSITRSISGKWGVEDSDE